LKLLEFAEWELYDFWTEMHPICTHFYQFGEFKKGRGKGVTQGSFPFEPLPGKASEKRGTNGDWPMFGSILWRGHTIPAKNSNGRFYLVQYALFIGYCTKSRSLPESAFNSPRTNKLITGEDTMTPEEARQYAKHSWWSDHLEWLLENKPALVKRLFRKNSEDLAIFLGQKVKQALRTQEIMVSQGTEDRVAEDWVFEEIISPALSVDPPNPLPEEFEEKVREWADSYGLNKDQNEQDTVWLSFKRKGAIPILYFLGGTIASLAAFAIRIFTTVFAAIFKVQVCLIINNRAGGNAPLIAEKIASRLHSEKQQRLFWIKKIGHLPSTFYLIIRIPSNPKGFKILDTDLVSMLRYVTYWNINLDALRIGLWAIEIWSERFADVLDVPLEQFDIMKPKGSLLLSPLRPADGSFMEKRLYR
jgi:hypothetical protein